MKPAPPVMQKRVSHGQMLSANAYSARWNTSQAADQQHDGDCR